MTSNGLSGLGVLVTRPAGQCDTLCNLVRARGGTAIPWPALDILPVKPDADATAELRRAGPEDIAIFVSRNAVRYGGPLLPVDRRALVTAVGPSTFRALDHAGLEPDIKPAGFDSESLLDAPELRDMSGRTAFIVRGQGGRKLLATELGRRGAKVVYIEVYRRRPRRPDADENKRLLDSWHSGGIGIYTATSVEILNAISDGLGASFTRLLAETPLVTPSRRVVKRSEESGHCADRILAPAPDDTSLVESMEEWWRQTRHAAGLHLKKE